MTTRYIAVQRTSSLPPLAAEEFDAAELIVHVPGAGTRRATGGAIKADAVGAAAEVAAAAGADAAAEYLALRWRPPTQLRFDDPLNSALLMMI